MTKIIAKLTYKTNRNQLLNILVFLLGIFLHQSARTGLGNLSVSDLLLAVTFFFLFVKDKFYLNRNYLIVILFFLTFISFISIFYTPIVFGIVANGKGFLVEIIKLLVLFAFFYLGVKLVEKGVIGKLLAVYSYSGLAIAIFGIIISLFNIPLFNDVLFKFGSRFNGLMNDPNYFAILQITTLPFFIKNSNINKILKALAIGIIIFSILLSGSKTGLLTLSVYLLFLFTELTLLSPNKITLQKTILNLVLLAILSLGLFLLLENLYSILDWLNYYFPATSRITLLFTDFSAAIVSDGSSRSGAWNIGIEIIELSPLFGIGVGNYSTIGNKLFGSGVIAHNTYIQLATEWGLPLTIIFFGGIIILILKILIKRKHSLYLSIQKDILIIFLIGSIGISLNNARFFWLILGAAIATYKILSNEE